MSVAERWGRWHREFIEIGYNSLDDSATEFDDVITLDIEFGSISVPVLLGTGPVLDRAATDAIRALDVDRVLVVVDRVVASLYPDDVRRFAGLGSLPGVVFVAPEGERCKTLRVLGELAETFLAGGATKLSLVLGFGGGAAMNLGGLAAALIYRLSRPPAVLRTDPAHNGPP
jgi:3-dehydroquinate synthetase